MFHAKLDVIKEPYVADQEFCTLYDCLVNGEYHDHHTLKECYLLMCGKLGVTYPRCHSPTMQEGAD